MSTVSEKHTASVAAQGGVVVAVVAEVVPLVQVSATHTEPSSQIPT